MLPKKEVCLFLAIALGLGLRWGHDYAEVIRYILMGMLFLSWIDSRVSPHTLRHPKLWRLVGTMLGLGLAGFIGLSSINSELALIAGLLAITPTALAAPVVTSLLRGRVEFVTASVLVTNSLAALLLPLILPAFVTYGAEPSGDSLWLNTLTVIGIPLTLAQAIRYWLPGVAGQIKRLKPLTFYLWLAGLYFASAKAGHFIRLNDQSLLMLSMIALVTLVLCGLNFGIGRWLGRPSLVQETGQALGQKNTMLAIWVCLTFLSPTLALGPMFYIVFQNVYNAYLLAKSPHR